MTFHLVKMVGHVCLGWIHVLPSSASVLHAGQDICVKYVSLYLPQDFAMLFIFFNVLYSWRMPGGGGHSNGKRGYQAHPWTHKKHPNHIFFRYENRP